MMVVDFIWPGDGLEFLFCTNVVPELIVNESPFGDDIGVVRAAGLPRSRVVPGGALSVSERIARPGLFLPSGLVLTETQLEQVCDMARKVLLA